MKTFKEMEDAFYKAVRQELLAGLAQCTEDNRRIFKLYAHRHPDWTIEKVVQRMPREKLNRALQQVHRTITPVQQVILGAKKRAEEARQ